MPLSRHSCVRHRTMGDEGNWRTIKGPRIRGRYARSRSLVRPLGRRMRICLIGDTHGFVPGLEAALGGVPAACPRPDRALRRLPDVAVFARSAGRERLNCCARRASGSFTATTRCISATGERRAGRATVAERAAASRLARLLPVADPTGGRPSSVPAELAWLRALPCRAFA